MHDIEYRRRLKMESTTHKVNTLKNQIDSPNITIFDYELAEQAPHLYSISHLKEAVLLREVAELRLKNLLSGYMFKS
jgi:3-mercaptopyruvate sulfurtransferase SseA